ncbi:MAG TPA: iron-sulfur cluster biosynthesis family protein, partial [Pyrinomonadaceae bacterium]|nr:iron-sulfur cluster biosynthesis family protein [Pyrinomonadaceae bacterium]
GGQRPAVVRTVVSFTPRAIEKLRDFRESQDEYVRVGVFLDQNKEFTYDVAFEVSPTSADDFASEQDLFQIRVRKDAASYLEGATIDWCVQPDGHEGFYFENPNALPDQPSH